jgi:hypothetical protein
VHAPDAAGGKQPDAGHFCQYHGACYSGCAVLSGRNDARDVTPAHLGHPVTGFCQQSYLICGQTGFQAASDDGHGRRDGSGSPYLKLHSKGGFGIPWIGHAMGYDGGFKGYNRAPLGKGFLQFVADVQIVIHG